MPSGRTVPPSRGDNEHVMLCVLSTFVSARTSLMGRVLLRRPIILACCAYEILLTAEAFVAPPFLKVPHSLSFSYRGIMNVGSSSEHERRSSSGHRRSSLHIAMDTRREWVAKISSTALLLSTPCCKPAVAATRPEPILQTLVELPNEETDWTKLLMDRARVPGASLLITASQESSGSKPILGATVAMEKLQFPVMMQLFPRNAIGGAKWPLDFNLRESFDIQVTVCFEGRKQGVACEYPLLSGTGKSEFLASLEDVPEIAEQGGVLIPATVVLEAAGDAPVE